MNIHKQRKLNQLKKKKEEIRNAIYTVKLQYTKGYEEASLMQPQDPDIELAVEEWLDKNHIYYCRTIDYNPLHNVIQYKFL